jgi:hypothetical protein
MADNRRVAEQVAQAYQDGDSEALVAILHPGFVAMYPQSGEVFRGRDNYVEMVANHPAPPTTVVGSGDTFVLEGAISYADGSTRQPVAILKIEDSLVVEEVSYFAEPFDAPEWRHLYVSS